MSSLVQPFDFVAFLPDVVWYLTGNGQDMWCRRPYGFLFTTSDAAAAFARQVGTELELVPIGVGRGDLMNPQALAGVKALGVSRLFIDPQIDAQSGDVHGRILRLEDGAALA
jgi:hypothetical protein